MPIMLLRRTIEQTFEYARTLAAAPSVDFIWHGGEPMAAGLKYYRQVVRTQLEVSRGIRYANSIQTNGTLINRNWTDFFQEHCFDVSLSLDGPESIHDSLRRYSSGKGSFAHVMRGIEELRRARIPHGVCVVISRANRDRTDEIFDFLIEQKLPFNVIPLTRSGDALNGFEELGLTPEEYAEPWIRLFDRWFESNGENYVQCTDFVRKARAILIGKPTDCIGQQQCAGQHISTDPDGFVYPCATLSGDPEWAYGNLNDSSLVELMNTERARSARSRAVDPHCEACKWRHVCHGGCMSRSVKFYGTHNTRDYYCPSLYRIYEHIEAKLRSVEGLDISALPPFAFRDMRGTPLERTLTDRRVGFARRSVVRQNMGDTKTSYSPEEAA